MNFRVHTTREDTEGSGCRKPEGNKERGGNEKGVVQRRFYSFGREVKFSNLFKNQINAT